MARYGVDGVVWSTDVLVTLVLNECLHFLLDSMRLCLFQLKSYLTYDQSRHGIDDELENCVCIDDGKVADTLSNLSPTSIILLRSLYQIKNIIQE